MCGDNQGAASPFVPLQRGSSRCGVFWGLVFQCAVIPMVIVGDSRYEARIPEQLRHSKFIDYRGVCSNFLSHQQNVWVF